MSPGQRFKWNSAVWEVVQVKPLNGLPHAKLVKVGDSTDRRTLAVSALLDSNDLVLVEGRQEPAANGD